MEANVIRSRTALHQVMHCALSGEGAHAETGDVFSGLSWKKAGARPRGAPHSLYQLLNHMIFWQEWVAQWLEGDPPPTPAHAADGWPGPVAPANREQWEQAVDRFRRGLVELDRRFRRGDPMAAHGGKSRLAMAQTIGAHQSYHAGQAALLRQMLGAWPPPSGGLTW